MPEDARSDPAGQLRRAPELKDCDLIIEAIAERMDWKLDLYTKRPTSPRTRSSRPTPSGLSITKLSEVLPEEIAALCGIHFFNPPRYMYLVS